MEKIHVIARFKIHNGKLPEFKQISAECISLTSNETGAELYDWFIDEENYQCTVIETYKDSDATLAHAGNVNEALTKLMTVSDFSGEVFGNASEELSGALEQMNIVPVPFHKGL